MEGLNGRRAAAILIALGTNDALQGRKQEEFEANYGSLLAQLRGATDHLVVAWHSLSRSARTHAA